MFTLGVAGGSGSGKSTLVEAVVARLPAGAAAVLPFDAYYRGRADLPDSVRADDNWDHPDALDTPLYLDHVDALRAGRGVRRPVYDFAVSARVPAAGEPVAPAAVLILEGVLLLHDPRVRDRIDLAVFVDTPADLRILRRVARDVVERGRTVESVTAQYRRTVRPMHAAFVEPTRWRADVVVPWEEHNGRAVDLLAARVRELTGRDD